MWSHHNYQQKVTYKLSIQHPWQRTSTRVQHAKYLWLTFSNNLSWNIHIDNITKKANATCAFLRRNMNSCSRQVKAQCYTTLVRPNLEYAATVWDPYTKFNINKLEKCQRRAARFVNGDYSIQLLIFNEVYSWVIFASQGLRFGSPSLHPWQI